MSLPAAAARLLERLGPSAMRLGLGPSRRLMAALGDPQDRFGVVLVAGTNGKGSTAAWLAAMATAAGYRTGLYTSPHLEQLEERVRIDGRAVAGGELGRQLLAAAAAAESTPDGPPTYFELVTAAAWSSFAAAGVELAVAEVGMGGRLDATNVARPELAVITDIGHDHERHLGSTIARIAAEKAGVLRAGKPVVVGCRRRAAAAVVRRVAAEIGARPVVEARAARRRRHADGGLTLGTASARYRLRPALPGVHQQHNLRLAVLAAETLAVRGWRRLDRAAIERGAAACRWPGRLESVSLGDGRAVLLDVAHNPDAAAALGSHLARLGRPYDLLFGTLADKRGDRMLPPLAAGARRVVLTRPRSDRALDPVALAELAPGATVEPRLGRALDLALDRAPGGAVELLVVCGSFYLVGEVRGLLRRRLGTPPPAAEIATC